MSKLILGLSQMEQWGQSHPWRVFHIETVRGEEGEFVKLGAACNELELVWVVCEHNSLEA